MKKEVDVLKEYVSRLSNDDVHFLFSRQQNLQGDKADILNFISRDKEIDRVFSKCDSATEVYNKIDSFNEIVTREIKARNK